MPAKPANPNRDPFVYTIAAMVWVYEENILQHAPKEGFWRPRPAHGVVYGLIKCRAYIREVYPELVFMESSADAFMPKWLKGAKNGLR